jgi:hypothetical protein
MRKGDFLGTYIGKQFWPLDPKPEEINLMDIAHALSNICRFNGHTNRFYSVAEHSLNVAKRLRDNNSFPSTILFGLLHDASEAYVCDIPRPLKRFIQGYKEIEENVQQAVYKALRLGYPEPCQKATIDAADRYLLAVESRELMRRTENWDLVDTDPSERLPHWNDIQSTYMTEVSLLLYEIREDKPFHLESME